ncbi:hypothetical protein L348_09262 [Enterobacter sp. MGH 2]|nr:hypothetical protein L348_09262 [Enterobacter sp. MGH 2]EZR12841.1 hypothetical protein L398_04978 [Enterobacter sp. BWH 27]
MRVTVRVVERGNPHNHMNLEKIVNYQSNEKMRQDAAAISNELYELWQKVKRFEREYSFNSKNLTDRLAGRLVGTMEPKLAELNKFMADIEFQFED